METSGTGARDALAILTAGALSRALATATAAYTQKTCRAFAFEMDTAGGVEKRAAAGAKPDLFASSTDSLDAIAATGAIAGAPRPMGSARIALGVRKGEIAPDISTFDVFKQRRPPVRRRSRAGIPVAAARRASISSRRRRGSA